MKLSKAAEPFERNVEMITARTKTDVMKLIELGHHVLDGRKEDALYDNYRMKTRFQVMVSLNKLQLLMPEKIQQMLCS